MLVAAFSTIRAACCRHPAAPLPCSSRPSERRPGRIPPVRTGPTCGQRPPARCRQLAAAPDALAWRPVSVGRKMGWGARESSESSAPPQTSRSWERSPRRDGRGGGDFDSIDGEECVRKERDLVDEVTVLGPGDVSQVGAVPRRWVLGDGAAASPEVAPRGPGRSVRGIRGRSAGVERRT